MAAQVTNSKRKMIADSSRSMFMWVAAMSVVVGMCAVVLLFLSQQIMFRIDVVGQMRNTLGVLQKNNSVSSELTSNIVVLETDPALNAAKANSDEKALQVVLDALPAERNPLALGSSLQQSILSGVNGLTIESLTVDSSSYIADDTETSSTTIPIQLQVSAKNANTIKDMLVRFERSIRVIDIDNFILERSDSSYHATIAAHAYYQPEKKVQLTETTIIPGGKK